ncbi:hypothetical protein FOZ61_006309 [Perkinsus olseni]|uniref:Peptidase A1 domain-containing protein n=1 Tax=Perkinsus olseni TaxID=32597 RepID=A0A7J6LPS0_PEROL|nr:hypothetical protein FOZ61_006309 [Perkinsus olseni]KAF4661183.1 hypothetical protein FOL46_005842 [Perkinsus olseni]
MRAALPPGVVDFPIRVGGNLSLVELVFDGQPVRLLPDTGGDQTYVLYKDAFGESACQTYAAGCYTCPNNSCVPSSWVNGSRRSADGTTFYYFRHAAQLDVDIGTETLKIEDYKLSVVKAYEPREQSPHPIPGLRREPSFARSRRSFIHQLVRGSGGAIRRSAFSLTFPRSSDDVGHLTVGGDPDPAWHTPFITLHQRDDQAWTLSIDEVGYREGSESESIGIEKGRVLFDSGARVIIGPVEEVTSLLNYISKFVEFRGGDILKLIACSDVDKLPEIWFDVKADDTEGLTTRLFVTGRDYAVAADKPGLCTIDIAGVDLVHIGHYGWILGSPLFRGYFQQFTYDVQSIGFAKKRSF